MIEYWNHEIYLLLDSKKIENLIKVGKESYYEDLNEIAQKVQNNIFKNRTDLIKHHIKYGSDKSF